MPFTPLVFESCKLHHYAPNLIAYEWPDPDAVGVHFSSKFPSKSPPSYLIFAGGLFDTLFSPKYLHMLNHHLPKPWRLIQAQLSSSGLGWGQSSLNQDAIEIGQLITWLHTLHNGHSFSLDNNADLTRVRIVLMGSSTGCQDLLTYANLSTSNHPNPSPAPCPLVLGLILQAPVSDRQALSTLPPPPSTSPFLSTTTSLAKSYLTSTPPRPLELLPLSHTSHYFQSTPVTASRWLSLVSPDSPEKPGEDDLFSDDLMDERLESTWGRVGKGVRVLVLEGESDEYVPESVDKEGLVMRWKGSVERGGSVWDVDSGVVEGADHTLEKCGEEVRGDVYGRIKRFLERVTEAQGGAGQGRL